ncbi:MAG TPA: hypothetical protein VJY62_19000 [Bacteroidia bacterium]|nr:hypothetical protein [Bacteroidia bacterium]
MTTKLSPETQKLLEDISAHQKRTKQIIIGLVAVAMISVLGAIFFAGNKVVEQQIQTTDSLQSKTKIIDSLATGYDSLSAKETRKDSIVKFITKFLAPKPDSLLSYFFADTLERYYLQPNVTLSQLKEIKKNRIGQYPRSKVFFTPADIKINISNPNRSEIVASVKYYEDSLENPRELIYQIKLNSDYKVFYVRNLIPAMR